MTASPRITLTPLGYLLMKNMHLLEENSLAFTSFEFILRKRPVLLTVKIGFTPGNLCLALFIECKSVIFLVGPY